MKRSGKWHSAYMGPKALLAGTIVAGLAAFAAPSHAATITPDPVTLNIGGGDNLLSLFDTWLINITGQDESGSDSMVLKVVASTALQALTTNTLNLPTGFHDPKIQWNSEFNGSGTVFDSLTSAQLNSGMTTTMLVSFMSGEAKYLIAEWEGIGPGRNNWDIRIEATAVPLPAGLLLFLSGLAGIGFLGRYKARRREAVAV